MQGVEFRVPDAAMLEQLLPVARRIFTATFAGNYDAVAFERFCDATYSPGGAMSRDFGVPEVRWQVAIVDGQPAHRFAAAPARRG